MYIFFISYILYFFNVCQYHRLLENVIRDSDKCDNFAFYICKISNEQVFDFAVSCFFSSKGTLAFVKISHVVNVFDLTPPQEFVPIAKRRRYDFVGVIFQLSVSFSHEIPL